MRGTYGPDQPYTKLAARALKLWAKYERRWKRQFLHRTGVLWMASSRDDSFERGSLALLREARIKFQELSTSAMRKRWPQVNFADVHWGIYEPECGYLDARASCQAVVDAFVGQGGVYRQLAVSADGLEAGPLRSLTLSDGSRLKADYYVFACGPWMGKLFPETLGKVIRSTKQDIFFFGTPAGDSRFTDAHLPVWGDHGKPLLLRHSRRRPSWLQGRRRHAWAVLRSNVRRESCQPGHAEARSRIYRVPFPAMKDAPLIETRVCQYEQTADSNFIVDRHPRMNNVWLLGGGSGHGFKHGPALGEMMAEFDSEGWRSGCCVAAVALSDAFVIPTHSVIATPSVIPSNARDPGFCQRGQRRERDQGTRIPRFARDDRCTELRQSY